MGLIFGELKWGGLHEKIGIPLNTEENQENVLLRRPVAGTFRMHTDF
jgi:hypothetical protein